MTTKRKREKPTADWPMYWHAAGYWCKTINKKKWYFGPRGDADSGPELDADAIDDFNQHLPSILAGRGKSREIGAGYEVRELCAAFLDAREILRESGEISDRTWRDYERISAIVANHFGNAFVEDIGPAEFSAYRQKLAKGRSIVTLANLVRVSRLVFRYAKTAGHVAAMPDFGDAFKEPSRKNLRKERNRQRREHGLKMFEAQQARQILDHEKTSVQMRAMVLLGLNAAYGNKDCSELLRQQITIEKPDGGGPARHWLDVERGKTQVFRRCPLWPETVAALAAVSESRPDPADPRDAGRVFLTHTGLPWVRDKTSSNDEVAKAFGKLLRAIVVGKDDAGRDVTMKRPGLSFYALRHTVETIGDRVRDKNALNMILGHVDNSMAAIYRERLDDDRLIAVTDYIRNWLWSRVCATCGESTFSVSPTWACANCDPAAATPAP